MTKIYNPTILSLNFWLKGDLSEAKELLNINCKYETQNQRLTIWTLNTQQYDYCYFAIFILNLQSFFQTIYNSRASEPFEMISLLKWFEQ
jgi:hypothetical protein